jgi:hypothetical protein
MLSLVVAVAMVIGQDDVKVRREKDRAEDQLFLRQAAPRAIARIQRTHPDLNEMEKPILAGKLALTMTHRQRIQELWAEFRSEDRNDPMNRFFRIGIAP